MLIVKQFAPRMQNDSQSKAILLMNLGSPDSFENKDVKKYLTEFLMDERVIDISQPFRSLLVKGIIVPFRTSGSAAKYKTIWTKDGSPLVHLTATLTKAVSATTDIPAAFCMRYGSPTAKDTLEELQATFPDLDELIVLPLYPHYAMSSYETAVEDVKDAFSKKNYSFSLKIVPPFYNHPAYINALAQSMAPYLQAEYDLMLFSYHGIPERHVKKTDPNKNHCLEQKDCCNVDSPAHHFCYRHQVFETTKLTAQHLRLPKDKYSVSFQSRLGRDKWLQPATAELLKELPAKGIKKLVIACPAFVSDCLETLEEIEMEGREIFMEAGGESYTLIPCLNTLPVWVEAVGTIIKDMDKRDFDVKSKAAKELIS